MATKIAWVFETIAIVLIVSVLFFYLTEYHNFVGLIIWIVMMICMIGMQYQNLHRDVLRRA